MQPNKAICSTLRIGAQYELQVTSVSWFVCCYGLTAKPILLVGDKRALHTVIGAKQHRRGVLEPGYCPFASM